ncbi:class I SAM-dependent methyltransferase [Nocardia sp. NPDC005366]|uniref:class I SAM-dependent methyltransferase n=1 Tax=Nocardia sp. NPDC005366 TaxID=3156878 RepID=UPI0033A7826B
MTTFRLSPERRDELAALLGDEHRLRDAYPAIADYLDSAPRLAGTGDDAADSAFDLRLLHYLTGGAADNPYWEIVGPAVASGPAIRGHRREANGGNHRGSARLGFAQTVLQSAYSYAIPAPETLDWITACCNGRRVVELGAGRGYWAAQLARRGVDVLAFDAAPPGIRSNLSFPRTSGVPLSWHPVGDLADFSRADITDAVLLLCWPPGWSDPMSSEALNAYREAGGDRLIYIGEPRGGRTANDTFFATLEVEWVLADQDPDFVAWWNLADVAQYWRTRG